MYNALVVDEYAELKGKYESKDDSNLTITMTEENLTGISRLNLNDKSIKNISGIEKFTNLQFLDLANHFSGSNQISDITPLANLTNLVELNLNRNQISDITPLANLINLTKLEFSYNPVSDINAISELKKLTSLSFISCQVKDISVLDNFVNLERVYFYGSKSTDIVSTKQYKLPSVITKKDKDTYMVDAIVKDVILTNCELSENGESIILKSGLKKGDTASIKIYMFQQLSQAPLPEMSLTLSIDEAYIEPPVPTIIYSKTEQTNENVTATIFFNKEGVKILNNDGKNTYDFTQNGEFTFEYEDENGNIGKATAKVENIDKEIPVGIISFDNTDEGVVATISFNKEGVTILNNDGKNTYNFTQNGEFTFEFVDKAGNKGKAIAKVTSIEKKLDSENLDNNFSNNENVNTGDLVSYFSIALVIATLSIGITSIVCKRKKQYKKIDLEKF